MARCRSIALVPYIYWPEINNYCLSVCYCCFNYCLLFIFASKLPRTLFGIHFNDIYLTLKIIETSFKQSIYIYIYTSHNTSCLKA